MKDINISKQRQKTEMKAFAVCLVIAFCLNIYAIIAYDGKWSELFWSLGFVCAAAFLFYTIWTVIRIVFFYIKKNTKKKK